MMDKMRVLAIDDDPLNQAIYEEIFAGDGYELSLGASCAEAIESVTAQRPDVLILDILLPDGSGYDVCRALRSDPDLRFTKIILVSCRRRVEERLEGYEAGADDYVTKPFAYDELIAKVQVFAKLKSIEELNEFKASVIRLLCHETRTPLNAIVGPAEMLAVSDDISREDRLEWADMILGSSRKLVELNEKVLMLSGLRGETLTIARHPVNLVPLIGAVTEEFRAIAAERRVDIRIEGPDELVVAGEDDSLQFVMRALIDNAMRVSPEESELVIEYERDGHSGRVAVIDQGPGIGPDLASCLFEEMAEVDIRHHHQGLGLSLALCRSIVEHLEGRIHAQSSPGRETRFTFELPAVKASSDPAQESVR